MTYQFRLVRSAFQSVMVLLLILTSSPLPAAAQPVSELNLSNSSLAVNKATAKYHFMSTPPVIFQAV